MKCGRLGDLGAKATAFVVLLLVQGAIAEDRSPSGPVMKVAASRFDEIPRRVALGEHVFDFPRNSFDLRPDPGEPQPIVLLRLLYPAMEGITAENRKAFDVVGPTARYLDIMLDHRPSHSRPEIRNGVLYIFSRYLALYANTFDEIRIERLYGLVFYERRRTREETIRPDYITGRDLFAESDFSNLQTVIECIPNQSRPNPNCEMYFMRDDITVKVRFVRPMLPEWSSIRNAVRGWLDTHLVKEPPRWSP